MLSTVSFVQSFDHDSELKHYIDPFPLQVADPNPNYKIIVGL